MTNYLDSTMFRLHLEELETRYVEAAGNNQVDGIALASGSNTYFFGDDQQPPFHANPHFLQWVPWANSENSVLLWEPNLQPKLLFYTPKDYWYQPSEPQPWMAEHFDVQIFDDIDTLWKRVLNWSAAKPHSVLIGTTPAGFQMQDSHQHDSKAESLAATLDYSRAWKTDFELNAIQDSTALAVQGHLAAEQAFREKRSEFDIQMAFLTASKQRESQSPYPSIVALNEHASVLHYQHYDMEPPDPYLSLLIDAGATHCCFHSDVTRSYVTEGHSQFQELINAVNSRQQQLVAELNPNIPYPEIHNRMHELTAEILVEQGIVTCSASSACEQQLTDVFFPHGIGHLLGLQTHDVGGYLQADGEEQTPDERYPSLRLTRRLESRMVVTIEPGIYFVPMLLESVVDHPDIAWDKVNQLLPYGGVRIEDNVYFDDNGNLVNLTRNAFEAATHRGGPI